MQKQLALDKIKSLVERFDEQKEFYKRAEYNETQTRRDFIDPFWKALGWDIDNENGYAESYREVIHEDRVKIGGATKAPDYSFRLVGGKRLFFLEAKKPSVAIKSDIQPAYQVRRYGWSAKMPISIITDFEEFAIYDCNAKPKPNDKASNGRIKYLTYDNYISEFDFIWDTFAKERVLRGSFDKYITSDKHKKGTSTVDNEFLQSLDKWRKELALNIALRNKNITEEELNFVVQHTIDRIIFLRIAEDRSVEQYGDLQTDIKSGDFYQNLLFRFHQADQKYNSGLFDFDKDKISKEISIDNKVIKSIISELYYPICPYEFSVLSVEILGSAYEQFLGKQISLSANGRAIIEEKPEVRKAGGVYYTPQYIVDYIVENTIGKQIQNKTPKEISKLKVVDPACGSGSFLIGAYQYLLDWHKDYYSNNGKPSKGNKNNPLTPLGELTTAEKKRILLNNIYGVDLDSNAVEVTKLSLLLKCMEGETKETIEAQTKLFHDRILPTLDNNIKSGNSLIDVDYYDNEIDFGEERKVKPFSWQKAFPEVFKNGGFDCVIGNPPYLKLTANNSNPSILSYYKNKFVTYSGGSSKNLFQLFIERITELKPKIFSFIVPEALLTTSSNGATRETLLKNHSISSIVTFDHFVFQDATIGTTIFVAEKKSKNATKVIKMNNKGHFDQTQVLNLTVTQQPWETSLDNTSKELFDKLIQNSVPMKELVNMSKGMVVKNRKEVLEDTQTSNNLPFLLGNCMNRYQLRYDKYANYNQLEIIGGTRDYTKQTATPRLLIRRTGGILCATYSDQKELVESTLYILTSDKLDLKFLLGVINSNLLTYFLAKKLLTNVQGFPQVLMGQLDQLPIANATQKQETEIIKHVDQLLHLNNEKQNTTLPNKLEMIVNRIEYAENKINQIVYEMYELTDDEIQQIEKQ
jgi:type I restriction-modification system DNA methylase subunit